MTPPTLIELLEPELCVVFHFHFHLNAASRVLRVATAPSQQEESVAIDTYQIQRILRYLYLAT